MVPLLSLVVPSSGNLNPFTYGNQPATGFDNHDWHGSLLPGAGVHPENIDDGMIVQDSL
jgi:hypothetical protein